MARPLASRLNRHSIWQAGCRPRLTRTAGTRAEVIDAYARSHFGGRSGRPLDTASVGQSDYLARAA